MNTPHSSVLPIGIGFLGWRLEQPNSGAVELLDAALESKPQAMWFSFGAKLEHWIEYVRQADEHRGEGHKTLIFAQINTVDEALIAINKWNVDILVAQGSGFKFFKRVNSHLKSSYSYSGIESGGHGSATAQKTSDLIAAILAASGGKCPPLLAAGGLANGKDVASMIRLGASGAVLGTRFVLSHESTYSDDQKKALLAATGDSTVRSMAFDSARNTLGWPAGVDGRGIRNKLVGVFNSHGVEAVQKEYSEGLRTRDIERAIVWAGTGVGLMNKIMSAGVSYHLSRPIT